MTGYDIVVVGSGVAGLSSAYRLAPDHEVLVIDAGAIGNGTSSRASGAITTPVDYPDLPDWSEHALSFFDELDGTGVFSFEQRPYVRPVRDADDNETRTEAAKEAVSLLTVEETHDRFPGVFSDLSEYEGALCYEETGVLDAVDLLSTLRHKGANRGVEYRPDTQVEGVLVESGAVRGVQTEYGPVRAQEVVVTAGSRTRDLLLDYVELPIRRITWNVGFFDPVEPLAVDFPIGGERSRAFYFRRTPDGHLLIGTENRSAEPDSEPHVSEEAKQRMLEWVPEILEPARDASLVRWEYCRLPDASTPDTRSIIDAPEEAPDGLVVAAGFHGTGVMSAGSIGSAVRALVTGEESPVPLDPFRLDRFETRSTTFEPGSLWG